MSQVCSKCSQDKPLNEFYKNTKTGVGVLKRCKACINKTSKKNYNINKQDIEWVNKFRERDRKRKAGNPVYIAKQKLKDNKKYRETHDKKFPEKFKANQLIRKFRKPGLDMHHWSYNDDHMFDVIELTKKQHKKAHRFLIYVQDYRMYCDLNDNLLDTKEKHNSYITKVINEQPD